MKVKSSRKLSLSLLLCLMLILSGCKLTIGNYSIDNFSVTRKKPFNFYYTNLLAKNLIQPSSCRGKILDTNFNKEKDMTDEDIAVVKNFVKTLKKKDFINVPEKLPQKPLYKIFLTFQKEKYIINVYNDRYISIFPYDGSFLMDYIDMTEVYPSFNIYGLCKYIIPR